MQPERYSKYLFMFRPTCALVQAHREKREVFGRQLEPVTLNILIHLLRVFVPACACVSRRCCCCWAVESSAEIFSFVSFVSLPLTVLLYFERLVLCREAAGVLTLTS